MPHFYWNRELHLQYRLGPAEAMASSEHHVIDFSALEKELQATLESDQKYQRENEAKLQALNQKVASYKEFRYQQRP